MLRFIFFLGCFLTGIFSKAQIVGFSSFDEYLRRSYLIQDLGVDSNLMIRYSFVERDSMMISKDTVFESFTKINFLPLFFHSRFDDKRPKDLAEFGMIPARGLQSFFSTGFKFNYSIINLQFLPEFVYAQNLPFSGFKDVFPSQVISDRFLYWNVGDIPERFGNKSYKKFLWGQSSLGLRAGSFELGIGTKNLWWGPGQWNSLIFSYNGPGFPHLSLNTLKPVKTFIGSFSSQILIGRLESSNQKPSQIDKLNSFYFTPLNTDWRYINALMLSYSPKWISGLSFGFARSFQYYNSDKPNDLKGWLPILEPMAKEKLFSNGNSVVYDNRKQSQQISISGIYKIKKAKAEIYFEFGRRDHALNWREFILNPEHARAYQFGFIKIVNLPTISKLFQIRGEVTHQQESINRILRYDLFGGISWHTHGRTRGFTNYGQPLGVGIGTGSNVQILEVSIVEDWNKWGLLFERLENNQDFYYRAFGQHDEQKPWIDWSAALLWNTSYKDLFLSARLQGTFARNYQWGLSQTSTPEFEVSQNLFSVHSQINLVYYWNRSFAKK
jgi:hypothetical protein